MGKLINRRNGGQQPTYDIKTAKNHNFFANGILVHNCGEQPLGPFMACNLSSLNLAAYVVDGIFDYEEFYNDTRLVTILMDNLIDVMHFPDERFKENVQKYRPIGIGFMGLADAMFLCDIKYNSKEGKDFVSAVTKTMTKASLDASCQLAAERGPFEDWDIVEEDMIEIIESLLAPLNELDQDLIKRIKTHGLRNCQHTTIAPTGTTALTCDCSYGIEPCFGLVWEKTLSEDGTKLKFVNPIFEARFKDEPWWSEDIVDKIFANDGSLKNIRGIPKEVRDVFVVAHDIRPKERIDIQAAAQNHISTAISSTVNLPHNATVDDIKEIYLYAYESGLKGVTVYRDGCKAIQPVSFRKEGLEVKSHFIRPTVLDKKSHCVQLFDGKLYIEPGIHEGRIVELWLNHGKSGQERMADLEGLGRSISVGVQHGVPIKEYVKQFKDVKGENPVWVRLLETDKRPVQIHSIPDAIAKVLERFYVKSEAEIPLNGGKRCPKCHNMTLIIMEGCSGGTCQSCGFSKCS